MSYNSCNLFDDIDNGTEYPEYDPSSDREWNSRLYHERLKRTGEVIAMASPPEGPDVICFQEIENKKVLKDLSSTYLKNYSYKYIISPDSDGSAITTGIISRYPLENVKYHSIFLEGFENLRTITEAQISTPANDFYIFNCHLKSKLGGAEFTEAARIEAAGAIRRRCREIISQNPDAEIIIAGDLNENIDEYQRQMGRYTTALMPLKEAGEGYDGKVLESSLIVTGNPENLQTEKSKAVFYSPWLEGKEAGSYFYRNSWETIDHFLLSPSLFNKKGFEYSGFEVLKKEALIRGSGEPLKWNSRSESGYSDHLPILLFLRLS
ncbi:MAG: endonuclease/exonuclease/phosphatase family protein [Spirochaetia bacterium]|jgi:endonuclease/exonuclease/phosphatase family metal-dependent hydrolase|nr:endonuclease/exonuclease/phosphatase family protein [Spirochaetia bacterium]